MNTVRYNRGGRTNTARYNKGGKMNTVRYNKGGKLKISQKTVRVDPPTGYHWMEENGRYFLMKGEYKPHPGAVAKAKFKLVSHG